MENSIDLIVGKVWCKKDQAFKELLLNVKIFYIKKILNVMFSNISKGLIVLYITVCIIK